MSGPAWRPPVPPFNGSKDISPKEERIIVSGSSDTQANGRPLLPSVVRHALIKVVLPEPAGAAISSQFALQANL